MRRAGQFCPEAPVALRIKLVELNRPLLWGLYRVARGRLDNPAIERGIRGKTRRRCGCRRRWWIDGHFGWSGLASCARRRSWLRDAVERIGAKMVDRIDGIRNCPDEEPAGAVATARDSARRSGGRAGRSDMVEAVVLHRGGWAERRPEQSPADRQVRCSHAVGQQSEVADAHEAARDGVQQEAAEELGSIQRHRARTIAVGVVLLAEGDGPIVHRHQPAIGDGDAMGVAGQILEHLLRAAEGRLGVNHPVVLDRCVEQSGKGAVVLDAVKFPGDPCMFEPSMNLPRKTRDSTRTGRKKPVRQESTCHRVTIRRRERRSGHADADRGSGPRCAGWP